MNQEILCLTQNRNSEIVTNYIVTERVSVGNKVFVLAENPDAPIPFITLEKTEEQAAYEKARQFKKREVALEDLYTRAVKAAKASNPFPYQPKKYDCSKCSYRNRETNFCGFCMMKIMDEMTEQNEIKEMKKRGRELQPVKCNRS
jgi:hypothetical protein